MRFSARPSPRSLAFLAVSGLIAAGFYLRQLPRKPDPVAGSARLPGNCSLPAPDVPPANLTAYGLRVAAESLAAEYGAEAGRLAGQPLLRQVLLVSYFRDGSSFLGELLNAYPGTFYLQLEAEQARSPRQTSEALQLISLLLHCQTSRAASYQTWAGKCLVAIRQNLPALSGCPIRSRLCFDPGFLDAWCSMHPTRLLKILRLRLEAARTLLDKLPELRIVYMARDPRGIYNSRRKLDWCRAVRSCISPEAFCKDMRWDLAAADAMREQFPGRFLQLRYEDLALDTERVVGRLLGFLRLEPSARMDAFLRSHTRPAAAAEADKPYSTFRDSKAVAHSWLKQLSRAEVRRVERACSDVIVRLGLGLVTFNYSDIIQRLEFPEENSF